MTIFKTPLSVYVLFDKDYTEGYTTYEDIYHLLCRNSNKPLEDGLDIPVFYRTDIEGKINPIDTDISEKVAVLLLVDENMYCSEIWQDYIGGLLTEQTNRKLKIFPISLYKYAFDINTSLSEKQFISFKKKGNIKDNWMEFQIRLFDDLIRYLKEFEIDQKLKLFISHSKKDKDKIGEVSALSLKSYLRSDTKLNSFFDANDIMDGYAFGEQIKNNVKGSLLVILETDTYSEREWCRIETITGKQNKVPSVLVNMLKGTTSRTFPYLGNMPKIRFNDSWEDVVVLLLRTALDQYYEELYLNSLVKKNKLNNTKVIPFTPELINLHDLNDGCTVIYPEPPLGTEELSILKRQGKIADFVTPSQIYSEMGFLHEKHIAISVSESEEINQKGIGKPMFDDLSVELARHILVAGGKLIYGGDLREGGFTELFCDLSCQYGLKEKADSNTVYFTNYFAWPISNRIKPSIIAEFKHSRVKVEKGPVPDEVDETSKNKFIKPDTPQAMYLWCKSLSCMREDMETKVNARIILGGRTIGFKGRMAGLYEEVLYAQKQNHPLYILGGFGGAAHRIVQLLKGKVTPDELFKESLADKMYSDYVEYCKKEKKVTIDYKDLDSLYNMGDTGLNNGLDKDENERLFESTNISEIVALILKGLKKTLA